MDQLKTYKYATWILILLNLSLVAWFFFTAPSRHHGHAGGKHTATDILQLDDAQHELFLELAQQHKQEMSKIDEQQRDFLKRYFSKIINGKSDTSSDLLPEIKELEQRKIESTYQHFLEIKKMLKPGQDADFERFVNHALDRILMKKKNKSRKTKSK